MAERLGEALLELGTDDRKLRRGLSVAEKRTRKTALAIGKVFAGLVTIAAVRGIVRSMDRVITRLDAIGKTASKLGLTAEALQEMRFAAERSGVAVQTFDMAFQRFTRRAAEAAAGTGEAKDALEQLGFTIDDLRRKSPEELFEQAAAALANVERESERLRLAFKLFDSEGVAIVNMVANLANLRQEARDLGIVLSDDLVRDATRMKDQLTNIFAVLDAKWARLVINFVNGINAMFAFIPETVEQQLASKIEDLAELTDLLQMPGVSGMGGAVVEVATERRKALLEEIDVLQELVDARKKAAEFSPGGLGAGAGADDRKATIDGITRAIENQIGALEEQALAFELSGGALAENIARNRAFNEIRREGIELTAEESDLIKLFAANLGAAADKLIEISEAHREAEDAAKRHADMIDRVGDSLISAASNVRDLDSALQALARILEDILRQQLRGAGGSGGGGGIFSSLLSGISGLFGGGGGGGGGGGFAGSTGTGFEPGSFGGFAHGGSFTVGGRGGTDQNLVRFNASRGERVTINKPGASSGVEVNVFAPPGSTVSEERNQVGDTEQINIMIDSATARNLSRLGTQSSRAMRSTFGQKQTLIQR